MLPKLFIYRLLFCLMVRFLSTLRFSTLQYDTMILQRIRAIVGDAEFEPRNYAPKVWYGALPMSHHISSKSQPEHLQLLKY